MREFVGLRVCASWELACADLRDSRLRVGNVSVSHVITSVTVTPRDLSLFCSLPLKRHRQTIIMSHTNLMTTDQRKLRLAIVINFYKFPVLLANATFEGTDSITTEA